MTALHQADKGNWICFTKNEEEFYKLLPANKLISCASCSNNVLRGLTDLDICIIVRVYDSHQGVRFASRDSLGHLHHHQRHASRQQW